MALGLGRCKNGTCCGLSAAIRKSIGSPGAAKDIHSTFLEDSLERFKEPLQTHPERNLVDPRPYNSKTPKALKALNPKL